MKSLGKLGILGKGKVKLAPLSEGGTVVATTSQELDITMILPEEIPGLQEPVFFPGEILLGVLKSFGNAPLKTSLKDGKLLLEGEGSSIEIHRVVEEEDLTLPHNVPLPKGYYIDPKELGKAIEAVRGAASKEDYRGVLKGANLSFEGDTLQVAASDGYRLARYTVPLGEEVEEVSITIPQNALSTLHRLLSGADRAYLAPGQGKFYLRVTGLPDIREVLLMGRLLDGTYPDYKGIIPTKGVKLVGSNPKGAVDRLSLFSSERVSLTVSEGEVALEASGPYGKGRESLPLKADSPANLRVSLNPSYLLGALESLEGEVTLLIPEAGPLLVEGGRYIGVIAPLREI